MEGGQALFRELIERIKETFPEELAKLIKQGAICIEIVLTLCEDSITNNLSGYLDDNSHEIEGEPGDENWNEVPDPVDEIKNDVAPDKGNKKNKKTLEFTEKDEDFLRTIRIKPA